MKEEEERVSWLATNPNHMKGFVTLASKLKKYRQGNFSFSYYQLANLLGYPW